MRRLLRSVLWVFAVASGLAGSHAVAQGRYVAGEEYRITLRHESETTTSDNSSSSSSSGGYAVVERVVDVRDDGVVLEYDFVPDTDEAARQRDWTLPMRVLLRQDGSKELLNSSKMEERLDLWLARAEWDRTICGRWIFTWNAFYINCDPEEALRYIESFALRSIAIQEGAEFSHPLADEAAPATRISAGSDGREYQVHFSVSPDKLWAQRAETDVTVAGFSGETITFEDALALRSQEKVSGTIVMTFRTDDSGVVVRREIVVDTISEIGDGVTESDRTVETTTLEELVSD